MNDASDSKEVRLEINIGASPETVFALLTDPTQMKTWLAEMVEANALPGGTFSISGPHGLAIRGIYQEVIPNKKVVFTWGGVEGVRPGQSTVEFLLERAAKARWLSCATTDCRRPRSNHIAAAGSIPGLSNSRMPPRDERRPAFAS